MVVLVNTMVYVEWHQYAIFRHARKVQDLIKLADHEALIAGSLALPRSRVMSGRVRRGKFQVDRKIAIVWLMFIYDLIFVVRNINTDAEKMIPATKWSRG